MCASIWIAWLLELSRDSCGSVSFQCPCMVYVLYSCFNLSQEWSKSTTNDGTFCCHICKTMRVLFDYILQQMMRHLLRVGLTSCFLISSTRMRIIWRRLSGAGRLLLAMADCTSSGILFQGTSKVSYHLLDVLADWLILLKEGDDAGEIISVLTGHDN